MDPHTWPCKSRTTSTNILSATMWGYRMLSWRLAWGDERWGKVAREGQGYPCYQHDMMMMMMTTFDPLLNHHELVRTIYIYIYHHHHVMPLARIYQILSRHFSLSFIASGRSSGLHSVSSRNCCLYVWAGRPAFDWPYAGSIGLHHLWDRPCFTSSVLHVWFV